MNNINFTAPGLKEQYSAAYLKNGVTRGITYQIKMLTWVAWKLSNGHMNDWWLATEVRNARGFHDLVLKYKISKDGESTPQYMYRFVQIKLKMSKNFTKINVNTMTSRLKNERQFSLIYLFKAYLNIINNSDEKIFPAQIKDLTIFTNRDVGNSIRFLIPVENDEVIGFQKRGKRYRIDAFMVQNERDIMRGLLQSCPDNGVILDFLKKVVFMVDQPPEPELEKLITEEMGKKYHMPQIFYNDLYKNITEWFLIYENGGKAPYLTEKHVTHYLTNAQNMLSDVRKMKMIFVDDPSSHLANDVKRLSMKE